MRAVALSAACLGAGSALLPGPGSNPYCWADVDRGRGDEVVRIDGFLALERQARCCGSAPGSATDPPGCFPPPAADYLGRAECCESQRPWADAQAEAAAPPPDVRGAERAYLAWPGRAVDREVRHFRLVAGEAGMVRPPYHDKPFAVVLPPWRGLGWSARFWRDHYARDYEPGSFAVFRRAVGPRTVVLDVGAWIGPTALFLAGRARHVVALEPSSSAFAELAYNFALSPARLARASLVGAALGSVNGRVLFSDMGASDDRPLARHGNLGLVARASEVPQISVASLWGRRSCPHPQPGPP